jgi:hypothetical protein
MHSINLRKLIGEGGLKGESLPKAPNTLAPALGTCRAFSVVSIYIFINLTNDCQPTYNKIYNHLNLGMKTHRDKVSLSGLEH